MRCLLFICLVFLACSDQNQDGGICVSFDQRSCDGDPWATKVNKQGDLVSQVNQFRSFLSENNIETIEILFDPDFHIVVCQACLVCPDGARIFIRIKDDELPEIEALDPLNLEVGDCSVF